MPRANPPLTILYEDNHLLVVAKPAGLPTMGAPGGCSSLLELAKQYVKQRYQKPGNVYLGIVSRLDSPVSGVVVLARTSKAAARLAEQFRSRTVEKTYWAAVEGVVSPLVGTLVDWVAHDERHRRVNIVGQTASQAKQAQLHYRRLRLLEVNLPARPTANHRRPGPMKTIRVSLLEVELQTGRKHQIRLQLAHRGHPILGDWKYGSRLWFAAGIALHARRLAFSHPTTGARLEFTSSLPDSWQPLGVGR